jgi:predicted DNA-binding transcriptional regulator AlpA
MEISGKRNMKTDRKRNDDKNPDGGRFANLDRMKTGRKRNNGKNPGQREVSPVLPPEGFVRIPVVIAVLGIGKTSFLSGVRKGKYPKPVKLGPRISAWRVEDIRAIIASFADT